MPETNPVLELAKEMGYNPEFEGEGKKSPEDFIKHSHTIVKNQSGKIKDLIKTVETQSSEFVKFQNTFNETITANEAKHKADLERQKATLETKLDSAVDEADVDGVKRIRKEISDIDKDINKAPTKDDKTEVNDDQAYFDKWVKEREWIETDKKAQKEFQKALIEVRFANDGKIQKAETELKEIETILKDKFPEKYGLKQKEEPPAGKIGEGKSDSKVTKEVKLSTLNAEEKEWYNRLKKLTGSKFDEKSTLASIGAVRASKENK